MSPFRPTRHRRTAVLVTAVPLALVLLSVLLGGSATLAQEGAVRATGGAAGTSGAARAGVAGQAQTGVRTIVGPVAPAGLPSLVEAQLHQQRAAQLQTMLQAMLRQQGAEVVTPEVDPRVDRATCSLLGRTFTAGPGGGCSRESCLAGHEYAKTGANAETCRIGGRRGSSYGVEVDFRRCGALHRVWMPLLNYCASDPHRTEVAVADAPQCVAPWTTYVVMSETPGSYDECVRPHRLAELRDLAAAAGVPLAQVAAVHSDVQCGWSPGRVVVDGTCVAGASPPAVSSDVAVIGDSITWRGTNELATLEPDWVVDGSSGRQVDALDERLAAYRAGHGEPGGVVVALGTNGRTGFTEDGFRAMVGQLPATTPVLLVTPYRAPGGTGRPELMSRYADWMRRLAVDRPLTCVADWRAEVERSPSLLVDGVHPTSLGEVYWAEMVDRTWTSCLASHGLTSS